MEKANGLLKKNELIPNLRFKEFKDIWKKGTIGDYYTNLRTGMTPSRTKPDYFKGDIPWISSGELNYSFIEKTNESITQEAIKDTNLKIYPPNTLFIAITGLEAPGTRGKCAMNKVPAATNQSCMAFEEIANVNTMFLFQWYKKNGIWLYFNFAQGTKQQSFNNKLVKDFILNIPSIPEQKKIASFLSAVDKKIEQLTRKKDLLEQYKNGVMQQIFSGKLRFKDENGNDYPNWEVKRIGEITTLLKDGTHGTHKDYPEGVHYLLSAKNINNGHISIDDTDRRISEEEYNSIYKNYKLQENDILLTIVGTIGRVAKYKFERNIAFQRSVAFFRFTNNNAEYMFQFMNGRRFQKELDLRKVISAQPGIYLGDLAKIPIKIPCIMEQNKIADYLSNIDNKIKYINNQITQTQTFKKGLLQQMFV